MRADPSTQRCSQTGFFLIEALVAILIFALGILGLIAMGGTAVASQSDAQYRSEAAALANAIASEIALNIDRSGGDATKAPAVATFAHLTGGANCAFAGTVVGNGAPNPEQTIVLGFLNLAAALPGAGPNAQQILVQTAAGQFNRVEITLCWKTANDSAPRKHTLVTYVN
ncbi:MAG: type IV pilus modification protein PilV [Pseudomonadota bacterium]|nr:type IV pilus modification protein PilV [Pseudomonadota bacterium]